MRYCCNTYIKLWKWLWNWIMNRGWKNFEVHDRKSLDCFKQIVGRKVDIWDVAGEGWKGSEQHVIESLYCLGEYIYCHKQDVARNTDIKAAAGEGSEGNEEHDFENERKRDPCYVVLGSLAELYSTRLYGIQNLWWPWIFSWGDIQAKCWKFSLVSSCYLQ